MIVPDEILGFREYLIEIVSDIGGDLLFTAYQKSKQLALLFAVFVGIHAEHDRGRAAALGNHHRLRRRLHAFQDCCRVLTEVRYGNEYRNSSHDCHLQSHHQTYHQTYH